MEEVEAQNPKVPKPEIRYPWDLSNFPENTDNLIYSNGVINEISSKSCPRKEQVFLSQKFKELGTDYMVARQPKQVTYVQSIPDIVQVGNQEEYFRTLHVPIPTCKLSPIEFNDFEASGFETGALTQDMAIKKKVLLDRIGTFSPALSLMLERPAAIVTQSAFIQRLEAHIQYEIKRCECPEPGYSMSWLFDMVRTNSILAEEPELVITDEPDEKLMARFKIYQKAFTSLCLHFENLRPILRDIKRNYEAVLCMKNKQIREVLIVKKAIEQYEKLLDAKREDIQREGYIQLNELQQQCFLLMRHVDKQDSAIRTMTEMLVKLEKSLTEEHDLRGDSEDQRRLLVVEVNELRRKYGLGPSGGVIATSAYLTNNSSNPEDEVVEEEDVITSDDPVLLRATLEGIRKTLSEAHHRITILEADYSDVVPASDYNVIKKEKDIFEERNQQTTETFNSLSSQIQGLRNQIESLMSECNTSHELLDDLKIKPTPRPSWTRIGDHFKRVVESEDESNKWSDVYDGNSTSVIATKLVEHLTGKKVRDLSLGHTDEILQGDFITPLGIQSGVPHYLRYNYYVINRNFSRREAISITQDIWQSRIEQLELYKKIKDSQDEEASGNYGYGYGIGAAAAPDKKAAAELQLPEELPVIHPFPQFVSHFLHSRNHLLHLRMEWTYNIIEACKLYPNDLKLSQWFGTVESRFDEAAYHLYRSQVESIKVALTKKSDENKTPGGLLVDIFTEVLKASFPFKTPEQIVELVESAAKQTGNYSKTVPIKYATFFVQTEDGLIGEFVTQIAKQLQDDIKKYVYDILGELLAELGVSLYAAENAELDPAGDTDVSMQQVYLAITTVDPTITNEKVGAAISWIFLGESTLPGQSQKSIPLVDYIKSHLRQKATMSGGGEDSDEEDDHDDDDFERVVRGIQQKRHSVVADPDGDEENNERNAIRRLKVANLRTVMRRLRGSALLRHGVRFLKSDSSPTTTPDPNIPSEGVADNKDPVSRTLARKSSGHSSNSISKATTSKKSVPVVDLYKRASIITTDKNKKIVTQTGPKKSAHF